MRGESDLPAGGLDLSFIEAAGCAAGPGGQRFRECSQPPQQSAEVMVTAQPGATVRGYAAAAALSAAATGGTIPPRTVCPGRPSNQPKR